MINRLVRAVCGLTLLVQMSLAGGEIIIDRTRVIYSAVVQGVTVNVRNEADGPRLVQVWIDEGDPQVLPQMSDVPFTVTPPILRLAAGQAQALRVVYHPVPGPPVLNPQESVYWLNVLGIRPTAETDNQLQFTFRTRIKLFLRPEALPGRVEDAVQALQWALGSDKPVLHVRNPSAFHVSLSSVVLMFEDAEYPSEDPPMLLPNASAEIAVKGWAAAWQGPATLRFTSLDDHGATHTHTLSLRRAEDFPIAMDVSIL